MKKLLITLLMLTLTVPAFAGAKMRADYTDYTKDASAWAALFFESDDFRGNYVTNHIASKDSLKMVISGAVYTSDGYEGGGIEFDGVDDQLKFSSRYCCNTIMHTQTPGSVSVWINPDSLGESNNGVITSASQNWPECAFSLAANNAIRIYCYGSTTPLHKVSANDVITLDEWQNIGFTYDGSGDSDGIKLFVAGVEVDSYTTEIDCNTCSTFANDTRQIGSRFGGANSFNGTMDNLYWIDREMTPAEMLDIYNNGLK